jgi:hypothetical protein
MTLCVLNILGLANLKSYQGNRELTARAASITLLKRVSNILAPADIGGYYFENCNPV